MGGVQRMVLATVFLFTPALYSFGETPQTPSVLLTGAWLVDGTGAAPVENAWVRLVGDRIVEVGQGSPPLSPGESVMDLKGRTILPGLADMHVHLGDLQQARWMLKVLLAHGVTRIKETGNTLGNLAAIRGWLHGESVVPRVYMSGVTINGSFEDLRFLKGEGTRGPLADNAAFGVEFLKAYNWDSSQALLQMADFAEAAGLTLTGHVPLGMTSVAAIDAGMRILEHVRLRPGEVLDDPEIIARYPIDLSVSRRSAYWAHLDPKADALRKTLDAWEKRKEKFFLDPTLVTQWAIANADGPAPAALASHLDVVSPRLLERWRSGSGRRREQGADALTPAEYAEVKQSAQGWVTFAGLAHAHGIRVLTGTDTPVEWVIPGHSLHQELEFMVRGGISPVEAIRCSTGTAADAFRTPDQGTIRAGHVADLVIVRGNVATDIPSVRQVERVILGGRVLDPTELLEEAKHLMSTEANGSALLRRLSARRSGSPQSP